jgi:hypothetical protein
MTPRRKKEIRAHLPAADLAHELRKLLDRAGTPTYVELGKLVFLKANALSQAADGRWVRWARVEVFVNALERHSPGLVTPTDWEHLRVLHAGATVRHRASRKSRTRADDSELLWEQTEQELREPGQQAAINRADGDWTITDNVRINRLNAVTKREDLIAMLRQLLQERGARIALNVLSIDELCGLVRTAGESEGNVLAWRGAWVRTENPEKDPLPQQRRPPEEMARWGPGEPESTHGPQRHRWRVLSTKRPRW